jgi:carbon monoxide dehydrogenase subunit G
MARLIASLDCPRSREDVFAYLADFSTTEEWDPGVVSARALEERPLGTGSRFAVVTGFLGTTTDWTYEILDFDAPRRVLLRGESEWLVSQDDITIVPVASGTRVFYDATLTAKGALAIADPLLQFTFAWVGRASIDGLARALGADKADTVAAV